MSCLLATPADLLGDAVGGGEDVVVVDKGAAAELTVPVHQGSLEQELLR